MKHALSPGRRPRRLIAAALSLGLVVAACGSSSEDVAVASSDTAATDGAARLDPAVLSGEAVTYTGDTFDLGSLAGKDLVVWFWAPW